MIKKPDKGFMQQALELAEKGRGKTLPNPMVGAVIAKGGRVLGAGYHRGPGQMHAEIAALSNANSDTTGATLYVNLEPCCHTGRTGACTVAIIESGIGRVVYATRDLNPLVNGKGDRILKKAGVKVDRGLLESEAVRLNDVYLGSMKNGRPFITVKTAQSIDGRIATMDNKSRWISSRDSRKFAHRLRSESDAVLVGAGTVRADNPALTTRLVKGKNPYRIVVSESLRFPNCCRLFDNNNDFKTIIATTDAGVKRFSRTKRGRSLIFWGLRKDTRGRIDLNDLIEKADSFGIKSILVEGGSSIITSFFKAALVDKFISVTAPMIIGKGIDAIDDLGTRDLSSSIRFSDHYRFRSGQDEVFVGYPKWSRK